MAIQSKKIPAPDFVRPKRALLSVSDKTGLVDFALKLKSHDIEIVSTGGTARSLMDAGLNVRDVSELTNFPEIMDGRVKTLHPNVHGGLLAIRDDPDHVDAMKAHDIVDIDMVVINLYPFEEVCFQNDDYPTIVENIDIGGPAMIRAAAKNHAYLTVLTDPADYSRVGDLLDENDGSITYAMRQELAALAYARTAAYDAAISGWFANRVGLDNPRHRAIGGILNNVMRYGENPHQTAGFYLTGEKRPGVATAQMKQGKQLSYNNINDTDAAFELVGEFDADRFAACAIIKHANPCGVCAAGSLKDAYLSALACDPTSAFGGIVAFNRQLDGETAQEVVKIFTEVIIAPSVTAEAEDIISQKKNLRLLVTGGLLDPRSPSIMVKTVAGGLLVQNRDNGVVDDIELNIVTKRAPTEAELRDLKFAFRVAKHVKSNAIIYVKDGATVGIGAGQMSRIDSSRIAARKAKEIADNLGLDAPLTQGSVVASDAFFPFADGLLSAVEAGATAVIQPGGSIRDDEIIAAADQAGIAMVFTGMRHFRH